MFNLKALLAALVILAVFLIGAGLLMPSIGEAEMEVLHWVLNSIRDFLEAAKSI